MIDVHMSHDQRADMLEGELDRQIARIGPLTGVLRTLKKPAVDQYRITFAEPQLVTRTGNATDGAVMQNLHRLSVDQVSGSGMSGEGSAHRLAPVNRVAPHGITAGFREPPDGQ
jgi:hypothetical protein